MKSNVVSLDSHISQYVKICNEQKKEVCQNLLLNVWKINCYNFELKNKTNVHGIEPINQKNIFQLKDTFFGLDPNVEGETERIWRKASKHSWKSYCSSTFKQPASGNTKVN